MKVIQTTDLVNQLFWSWFQTAQDTITLLLQFAEYQAQRLFQHLPNNRLLQLIPCWRCFFRMKAQLTPLQEQDPRERADANQKNRPTNQPREDGRERTSAPSKSIYGLFDNDGRLDVFNMRKLVYERGTHPSERKITWKFLFGVYPEKSTTEERKELDRQMASQYQWMKHSWKQRFPWAATLRTQCDFELSLAIQKHNEDQREMEAANPPTDIYSENSASFQYVNEQQFQKALRDIDADIPRTDRHRTFFQREGLVKLLCLRDILITFAAFHQDQGCPTLTILRPVDTWERLVVKKEEIGYCRGMHYFASRFLETLDSETEAFWCFVGYMRRSAWGFTTTGVRRKIQICEELLKHVDPELYDHIENVSKEKLLFCLRWLLLLFQKDLEHSDAVRVLEISALESGKMNFGAWIWRTRREGVEAPAPISSVDRDEITFEVLLCIAVLIQNRKQLLQYQDVNDFFLFTQSTVGQQHNFCLEGSHRIFSIFGEIQIPGCLTHTQKSKLLSCVDIRNRAGRDLEILESSSLLKQKTLYNLRQVTV